MSSYLLEQSSLHGVSLLTLLLLKTSHWQNSEDLWLFFCLEKKQVPLFLIEIIPKDFVRTLDISSTCLLLSLPDVKYEHSGWNHWTWSWQIRSFTCQILPWHDQVNDAENSQFVKKSLTPLDDLPFFSTKHFLQRQFSQDPGNFKLVHRREVKQIFGIHCPFFHFDPRNLWRIKLRKRCRRKC